MKLFVFVDDSQPAREKRNKALPQIAAQVLKQLRK